MKLAYARMPHQYEYGTRHISIVDNYGKALAMTTTSYTAKTFYGMFTWGLNAQQAINLPNFGSLNGPTLLEQQRFPVTAVEALEARGHEVREMDMASGLLAIQKTSSGFFGGADPRREGVVRGD